MVKSWTLGTSGSETVDWDLTGISLGCHFTSVFWGQAAVHSRIHGSQEVERRCGTAVSPALLHPDNVSSEPAAVSV